MSNKHYFVKYYKDFANTYILVWTDNQHDEDCAVSEGYTRITRHKAINLCIKERKLQRYQPNSSGYASSYVMPYAHGKAYARMDNVSGYIVEKNQCYV